MSDIVKNQHWFLKKKDFTKEEFIGYASSGYFHPNGDEITSIESQLKFINKLYNDFESRTCSNCEYFRASLRFCSKSVSINGYTDKDFGCNKFKRK